MEIPNDAIRRYADNIYWCCDESRNEAMRQLLSWMAEHPGATIGETRDYAIEMLGQVCSVYGDSSAAVAAEFFEAIVSAEGYNDLVATVYEGPDLDAIERGVRYQTGKLVNGDTDGFVDGVSELAWYHTKRAANQTSYQSATSRLMSSDYFETTSKAKRREAYNAGRRNKSRIRYARVPTGIETCTYCVMLASRGFVYRDEEVAGHGDHRGCDCLIVPGVAGSTTIGGYDREQMLELYSRYDQIDHEAPLDDDGNLLTGKAAEEWRDTRKREAMRDVIGREQWSVGSGEVRKTESGHVWQRGRRVQGLEGLDRVELGRRYAEIDRTAYYDSAGRPLRGSALEQRRRSEKIAVEQRMLRETATGYSVEAVPSRQRPKRPQIDNPFFKEEMSESELEAYNGWALESLIGETGYTRGEAKELQSALIEYFSPDYRRILSGESPEIVNIIDRGLARMQPYDGPVFRGLRIYEGIDNPFANLDPGGEVPIFRLSSWSSALDVAVDYSKPEGVCDSVILVCENNVSGIGMQHVSKTGRMESEVLIPSATRWEVVGVSRTPKTQWLEEAGFASDPALETQSVYEIHIREV